MGDVVIIGGGFAGLTAARVLSRGRRVLGQGRILLIDAKKTFDFLPLLPDVAGGRVRQEHALMSLPHLLGKMGVNFDHGRVVRVDTQTREVFLADGRVLAYEFLVVAAGSQTDFFGMQDVEHRSLRLDDVQGARRIHDMVVASAQKNIFVIGGGYTGVEVATHLAVSLRRRGVKAYHLHLVEKGEDILSLLPDWMKDYVRLELCRLKVQVHNGCSVSGFSDEKLALSDGRVFEHPLVIWAAGVKTPAFVRELPFEKDRQGRLVVDETLQFHPGCFAVGDCACIRYRGSALRMAVMFSISAGATAAKNILRSVSGGQRLVSFRPLDLGYIIPLAHAKSCGRVLFFRMRGLLGWLFHYTMCLYRAPGVRLRVMMAGDIFLPRGRRHRL